MKQLLLLLSLLCVTHLSSRSQELHLSHTQFFGGTHLGSFATEAIKTKSGNILYTYYTQDSGTGSIPACSPYQADRQTVIGMMDSLGNQIWAKRYCANEANGRFLCETKDGGFAMLGGTIDPQFGDTLSPQLALFKLNATGEVQWMNAWGSSRHEEAIDLLATPDGGFLIFGGSLGEDGDIPFNYTPQTPLQPFDWVLIKVDSIGNKQWVKVLGTSEDQAPYGAVVTDGTYYYLTSATRTKDHDCVDTVGREGYMGSSNYVIKLTDSGTVVWSKAYGEGNTYNAIFDDRDSTLVMVGMSDGNVFEFTGFHGYTDMFAYKVDRDGNFKWATLMGDANPERGYSVCKAPDGGYAVLGNTEGNFQDTANHIGRADGWLFYLSNGGTILKNKIFGGIGYETGWPPGFCALNFGNRIVATGTASSWTFSEGIGINITPDTSGTQLGYGSAYYSFIDIWPLGIDDRFTPTVDDIIRAYPNPATDELTVEFFMLHSDGILSLLTAEGSILQTHTISKNLSKKSLSVNALPRGTYFLRWQEKSKFSKSLKIILN